MKGLFVVFHGFSAHSGISKKIFAQCDALRRNGADIELCHIEIAPDGTQRRMVGGQAIRTFGKGLRAKLEKRVSLSDITRYIRHEGVEFLYIRHDHNASPVLIHWLRKVKKLGVRIALEIPTYPYDAEFAQSPAVRKLKLRIDRMFRCRMARYIDRIVTFSDDTEIFGRPTIRISNGIDFRSIPLKTQVHGDHHNLRLLAVANIHFWHGLDRVIEGLRDYYAAPHQCIVRLRIAGDGVETLIAEYRRMIDAYSLAEYAEVIGPRSGAALDAEFEWCDMGIASLGRHRNGITGIKTLKNREYTARGIPFVYSERDSDFDGFAIHQGDYLALEEHQLFGTDRDLESMLDRLAHSEGHQEAEFISIFYGEDVTEEQAQRAEEIFAAACPKAEVSLLPGGQPVYYYMISAE